MDPRGHLRSACQRVGREQARRLTEVPTVARNLIGDLLEIDPATIDVSLLVRLPSQLQEWVELYRDAEVSRAPPAPKRRSPAVAPRPHYSVPA